MQTQTCQTQTCQEGTGKATDFKFGRYIHSVDPNKSPLKILEKRERGRIQEVPKFLGWPPLSQERTFSMLTSTAHLQILYAHSQDRSEQNPIKNREK